MTFVYDEDLRLYKVRETGLASTSPPGPNIANSADWIAWHFTRISFLPEIIKSGGLLCDSAANQSTILGNADIKARRLHTPVALPGYPESTVGDHVPFYFAPRSPTSFKVLRSTARADELVFLGVRVGDIARSSLWCATDGNAALSSLTAYTRDPDGIGAHVDLEVLCAQYWKDGTGEDQDRLRRRHAELLVHHYVPLPLVSSVVCYGHSQLVAAHALLQSVGGVRKYAVDTNMFMT